MKKQVLTQFASHANTIADTFRAAFVKTKVGECSVEMTAPEESTKGGLLGLQHATLRTPEGRAILVGSIHAGERKADFKTWAHVAHLHEGRFNRAPPFTQEDYDAFLAKAEPILQAFSMEVTTSDAPVEPPKPPEAAGLEARTPPPSKARRIAVTVLFVVALIAIITGGLFFGAAWIKH